MKPNRSSSRIHRVLTVGLTAAVLGCACAPSEAAVRLEGQVQAGGGPVANSTVTLWVASTGEPRQIGQTRTSSDGRFTLGSDEPVGADVILYVLAKGGEAAVNRGSGDNPAIAMLSVLGNSPPSTVVINEMTTVASVWTANQFLDGTAIKGHALGLKIAAGKPPKGSAPTDTLTAAQAIVRYPWYQPERAFRLLDELYPVPAGKTMRPVPFMPYLRFSPSAWVLPLKFDGGGYRAGGRAMFDSEGNLWVGDNFTIGWQGQDSLWQGNATKFNPNGKPISPSPTGFAGGGMQGGTFGLAVDAYDNAWFGTYGGKSIAVFDKNGKPLTPPEGITFNGRLGLMQGIIAAPNGDVWSLGLSKTQLLHFPKGDLTKGRIVCEGDSAEPCKSFLGPFHLAIDQQDRIWVSNASDKVTRFPAADPSKTENFKTGIVNSGLNVDSQGNVWVTNRFGHGLLGMAHLVDMAAHLKVEGFESATEYLTRTMSKQKGRDGSVTLLRPDSTQYPGSPFTSGGLPGPWAVVIDSNDNVWISNFAMPNSPITQLCGVRTENCPPGMKTGDQISPPGGYVGGGLQMQTDLAISPSGDVWVMNNWQDIDSCYRNASEALSTRCGGQGVTVFHGMAKPVRAPQIGPARPYS